MVAPTSGGLADDERVELESLRAQVQRLEGEQATVVAGGAVRRRGVGLRWVASAVLLVLFAVALLGAVVARYAHSTVLDTDSYVATVTPLGSDPEVQAAIADQISAQILTRLDLERLTTEALRALTENADRIPPQVVSLAPVLAGQAESLVRSTVARVVASDQFERLWVAANRTAHANLVSVLTGEGDTSLSASATGEVTLSLGPVIDEVRSRLSENGFAFVDSLPSINPQFVVFTSDKVVTAQRAVALLDRAANLLPWIALVLAACAVWVVPRGRRRRAVVLVGVVGMVAMVLLALGLNAGRAAYLGAVPADTLSPAAATTLIDTFLAPLRGSLRGVFAVALVVALAAFLVGLGRTAWSAVRRAARLRSGTAENAREPSALEVWAARSQWVLVAVVLVLAGAVLAFWTSPSGAVVLTVVVVAIVLVLAVLALAAPARAPAVVVGTELAEPVAGP